MFRPNLVDCILEERVAPAIANLASIILTTSGYTLVEAFPGANTNASSTTVATSAASVSGVATPTSLYITGTQGISSLKPGNITGVPSLAAGAAGAGGIAISVAVGSGADAAGGPTNNVSNGGATNNVVGRSTVADPTANPTDHGHWWCLEWCELPCSAPGTKLSRLRASSGHRLVEHGATVRHGWARDERRSLCPQPTNGCTDARSL